MVGERREQNATLQTLRRRSPNMFFTSVFNCQRFENPPDVVFTFAARTVFVIKTTIHVICVFCVLCFEDFSPKEKRCGRFLGKVSPPPPPRDYVHYRQLICSLSATDRSARSLRDRASRPGGLRDHAQKQSNGIRHRIFYTFCDVLFAYCVFQRCVCVVLRLVSFFGDAKMVGERREQNATLQTLRKRPSNMFFTSVFNCQSFENAPDVFFTFAARTAFVIKTTIHVICDQK